MNIAQLSPEQIVALAKLSAEQLSAIFGTTKSSDSSIVTNDDLRNALMGIFPGLEYKPTDDAVCKLQNLFLKVPKHLRIEYKLGPNVVKCLFVITKNGNILTKQDVETMFPQAKALDLLWQQGKYIGDFGWETNDQVISCLGLRLRYAGDPLKNTNYADKEVLRKVHEYFSKN